MRFNIDFFRNNDPNKLPAVKRKQIAIEFLESALRLDNSIIPQQPNLENINLQRWLSSEFFVIMLAFIYKMNEYEKLRKILFSAFRENFYFSEQKKALEIGIQVYSQFHVFVPDFTGASNFERRKRHNHNLISNDKKFDTIPSEYSNKLETATVKKSHDFEDSLIANRPNSGIEFAKKTLISIMQKAVYRNARGFLIKRIVLYTLAGILFLAAATALAYLTIQTLGLIHLLWIPVSILAVSAGTATATGAALAVCASPKAYNPIVSFFTGMKKKDPDLSKLAARGMYA